MYSLCGPLNSKDRKPQTHAWWFANSKPSNSCSLETVPGRTRTGLELQQPPTPLVCVCKVNPVSPGLRQTFRPSEWWRAVSCCMQRARPQSPCICVDLNNLMASVDCVSGYIHIPGLMVYETKRKSNVKGIHQAWWPLVPVASLSYYSWAE